MPITDIHVHLYPPEAAADPAAWALCRGESVWGGLVTPHPERKAVQGWADEKRLLQDMDAAGIDRVILQGWYWERQETCEEMNTFALSLVRAHPDRIGAFAALQLRDGKRALDAVRAAREQGFLGFGELSPHAQGVDPDSSVLSEFLNMAGEWRMPVLFHVSEPVGVSYPGKIATPPGDFQKLARDHPGTRFILAHWGGGLPFYELNRKVAQDLKNVWYDTAASPLIYSPDVFRRVCDLIGCERILFGTDYPLLTFPRTQKEPGFQQFLEYVDRGGLRPEERSAILGGNARREFGW